jgi:hypothetical protein
MNFIAMSPSNKGGLEARFDKNTQFLDNQKAVIWPDNDRIAFFTSQVGLPVYAFHPVNGEFRDAYERIYKEYVRKKDFPSHTDSQFEGPEHEEPDALLPSLEPIRSPRVIDSAMTTFVKLWSYGAIKIQAPSPSTKPPSTGKLWLEVEFDGRPVNRVLGTKPGRVNLYTAYTNFRRAYFSSVKDVAEKDKAEATLDLVAINGWLRVKDEELIRIASESGEESTVTEKFKDIRNEIKRRRDEDKSSSSTERREELERNMRDRIEEIVASGRRPPSRHERPLAGRALVSRIPGRVRHAGLRDAREGPQVPARVAAAGPLPPHRGRGGASPFERPGGEPQPETAGAGDHTDRWG